MSLYADFSRETAGHSISRLDKFMGFLATKLSGPDYERARLMLHAACSPAVARNLDLADDEARRADVREAAERALRKSSAPLEEAPPERLQRRSERN
jgi:hypothetical protein